MSTYHEFGPITTNSAAEGQLIHRPQKVEAQPEAIANARQMTLIELFDHGYVPKRIPFASASTLRQYRASIRNVGKFLKREPVLDDLHDHVVMGAARWMLTNGRAQQTARKLQDNLLSIWRFAARQNLVDRWPKVALVQPPEHTPIAWTREQLHRLIQSCDEQLGIVGSVPASIWWHSVHAVLWDSAERIAAVLAIDRNAVDLKTGWLTIHAEHRKGKRRDNTIKLHPDTCEALALQMEWLPPNQTQMFPWPYDLGTLYNKYVVILKRAGLPHDRHHKFHCLRRSAASYFEAGGHDAMKLLGHTSRAVTGRYIDPTICKPVQPSDVLFRLERGDDSEGVA